MNTMAVENALTTAQTVTTGTLLIGTGLAFASLILLPAAATHLGMSATLTGALRIALMRASSRTTRRKNAEGEDVSVEISCH
jgi:hypothetical protein